MKLFSLILAAMVSALLAFTLVNRAPVKTRSIPVTKKRFSLSCQPSWPQVEELLEQSDIPPMPGAGSYSWNIHTKNDSARFYFNQGINMYYGFHIIESLASFKKASRFDPVNPMVWWAQALAYGPNINDAEYIASPLALEAVQKAETLTQHATALEKSLISAMSKRYARDSLLTREMLNHRYTIEMETVFTQFRGEPDAAVLYADALMLEHPWLLWKKDKTPYPWTPRIRMVLEEVLAYAPQHPGANHYYIHVMEPSPIPEKALASAERLGKLNPGLSHLVHMPSHIYLRTGQFKTGYTVNEEALKQFKLYASLFPPSTAAEVLYRIHNEHMLINCGMHAGRKKYSIEAATALQNSIDPSQLSQGGGYGNYLQYVYMSPVLMQVRFSEWDRLLNLPAPDKAWIYANLLWHFGRGMAACGKNNPDLANQEMRAVSELLRDSSLAASYYPFSTALEGAQVAAEMLQGTILMQEGDVTHAILHLVLSVETEKNMVYNEPRDWLLNPKNYLAQAYVKTGNTHAAEKLFNEDLDDNQNNVWSLYGLYTLLQKKNKPAEALAVRTRLIKAAAQSDMNFLPAK